MSDSINFYDTDENFANKIRTERERCKNTNYVEPNWSKIRLVRKWADTNATRSSYNHVLKETNVKWAKVTHLRKSGIEAASAAGLDAQSIATMSKHTIERSGKLNTAYVTELFPPVLLWASGFDKDSIYSYNNPPTRTKIPFDVDNIIWPKLAEWRPTKKCTWR